MPKLPTDDKPRKPLPKGVGAREIPKHLTKVAPLWKGPMEEGITFSLLSRFLCCRERFRLLVVHGLKEADKFNHRLEFGNMWHKCEEIYASNPMTREPQWQHGLADYRDKLFHKYPMSRSQIDHWMSVVLVTFTEYLKWWSQHPDQEKVKQLAPEQVFEVKYPLPSGRVVILKGKRDGLDLLGKPAKEGSGIYLFETKTKGDLIPQQLQRQLLFDLQTMMYTVSAIYDPNVQSMVKELKTPIVGLRYNVIRRPLSGGRGSITRHKPTKKNRHGETADEFYDRLQGVINTAHGKEWELDEGEHHFFYRWKVMISQADISIFRNQCFDPILESLCDWWEWIMAAPKDPWPNGKHGLDKVGIHHRAPYGVWNPLAEGAMSEVDHYLDSGSMVGLHHAKTLFPELEDLD